LQYKTRSPLGALVHKSTHHSRIPVFVPDKQLGTGTGASEMECI
jgi:hypothetical protein